MQMESTNQNDPQIGKIQGLLDHYLATRETERSADNFASAHLDEDSLAAFVEGTISDREAKPAVSHLVDCSFCRHVTAELISLNAAFAENEVITAQPASKEPSRVSDVLSGILERMFGSNESAVFAHSDEEKKDKERDQAEDKD
jgi:hypothetical protein